MRGGCCPIQTTVPNVPDCRMVHQVQAASLPTLCSFPNVGRKELKSQRTVPHRLTGLSPTTSPRKYGTRIQNSQNRTFVHIIPARGGACQHIRETFLKPKQMPATSAFAELPRDVGRATLRSFAAKSYALT